MSINQSVKSVQNALKTRLEAQFRASAGTDAQQNVCLYLRYMRDVAYSKLLQDLPINEDRNILVGELRTLQKLLDVLDQRKDTVELYNIAPSIELS